MVTAMKVKKIHLIIPEFEIEFVGNPLKCWFLLASAYPRMIKIRKGKFDIDIKSPIHKYAGTVYKFNVWFVCIPKIKVVKSE